MFVRDIMATHVSTCHPEDDIKTVMRMMMDEDIGAVPITDQAGHPVGMITDRDIAMEAFKKEKDMFRMRAGDIGLKPVTTCKPEENVLDALEHMRETGVRRLAVVDKEGCILGVLSLGDVIDKACDSSGRWQIPASNLLSMLTKVTAHHTYH